MKVLAVVYSLDGSSAAVGEAIRAAAQADVVRVEPVDEKRRTGFAKFLWGGSQVIFHKKVPLKPVSVDWDKYDLVIFGGPVWAGSPSPALRTFLEGTAISGKKAAVFCCHQGGKGQALGKTRALLAKNDIVGEIDFENVPRMDKNALSEKVNTWVKTLGV
jgi:flavodoxin